MRTVSAPSIVPSIENGCSDLHRGAIHCTGIHAAVARIVWPKKTAEHWAEAAGVKVRMAKYWLAGDYEVAPAGKLAIIRLLD